MINHSMSSIVVPLDKEGERVICSPLEDQYNYLVFPFKRADMPTLFEKLFFDAINRKLGLQIDRGQTESICDQDKIQALIDYLASAAFKSIVHKNGENAENWTADYYLEMITLMAKKALHFKTSIWFHFKTLRNEKQNRLKRVIKYVMPT